MSTQTGKLSQPKKFTPRPLLGNRHQELLARLKAKPQPGVVETAEIYQELLKDFNVHQVAGLTGRARTTIQGYLMWLEADPELQALANKHKIPISYKVIHQLLKVPRPDRVELVGELADVHRYVGVEMILNACAIYNAKRRSRRQKPQQPPMVKYAGVPLEEADISLGRETLRRAADRMCTGCLVREESKHLKEPGWLLALQTAESVCRACATYNIPLVCVECPGVAFVRGLYVLSSQAAEARPHGRDSMERLEAAGQPLTEEDK